MPRCRREPNGGMEWHGYSLVGVAGFMMIHSNRSSPFGRKCGFDLIVEDMMHPSALRMPKSLIFVWLFVAFCDSCTAEAFLTLGGPRSGTQFHAHGPAFLLLAAGKKRS